VLPAVRSYLAEMVKFDSAGATTPAQAVAHFHAGSVNSTSAAVFWLAAIADQAYGTAAAATDSFIDAMFRG
jgi:hypothetical protein